MGDWKLVPVEPTKKMLGAVNWPFGVIIPLIHIYRDMLAAAPDSDELTALRAENERLKEQQADYEESYRMTISGQCAPDEKHCACVPHLRARVAELEALLKDAETSLDPHYDMALVIEIREALAGKEKA